MGVELDRCEDGLRVQKTCVYFAAILSLLATVFGLNACVAPVWLWDYDCDCIPWEGGQFRSPEEFEFAEVLSVSPWAASASPAYHAINNRTTAIVPEDCKLSQGLLYWSEVDKYNVCEKDSEIFQTFGYRFCDNNGKFNVPAEIYAIQAMCYIAAIFAVLGTIAGFSAPSFRYRVSQAAAWLSGFAGVFAIIAFLIFHTWGYVVDLLDHSKDTALPALACNQPGMEPQVIPIFSSMQSGPTFWMLLAVVILELLATIIYACAGTDFVLGSDDDEDSQRSNTRGRTSSRDRGRGRGRTSSHGRGRGRGRSDDKQEEDDEQPQGPFGYVRNQASSFRTWVGSKYNNNNNNNNNNNSTDMVSRASDESSSRRGNNSRQRSRQRRPASNNRKSSYSQRSDSYDRRSESESDDGGYSSSSRTSSVLRQSRIPPPPRHKKGHRSSRRSSRQSSEQSFKQNYKSPRRSQAITEGSEESGSEDSYDKYRSKSRRR